MITFRAEDGKVGANGCDAIGCIVTSLTAKQRQAAYLRVRQCALTRERLDDARTEFAPARRRGRWNPLVAKGCQLPGVATFAEIREFLIDRFLEPDRACLFSDQFLAKAARCDVVSGCVLNLSRVVEREIAQLVRWRKEGLQMGSRVGHQYDGDDCGERDESAMFTAIHPRRVFRSESPAERA